MKWYKYLALATLAIPFVACDDIKEDERFEHVDLSEAVPKVVLIEEFTGQRCVNCPGGAAAVHSLLEMFPNNLVAVSMYPEQMTDLTAPITNVDLRTKEASEYFSAYDGPSKGLPSALVDQTPYDGSMLQMTPDSWSSPVISQLFGVPTPVLIKMDGDYDSDTRELKVSYNLDFIANVNEEVSFQLWIIENDIIAPQFSTNPSLIPFYEHQHVLRAAINGTWGEKISNKGFTKGDTYNGTGSVTLKDDWKAENCQVVGFLYKTSNRQVLQAHLLKSFVNVD